MSKLESRIVSGEDDEEDEEEEYSPSIQSQDTRDFPRTGQPLIRPTLIPSTAIMFGPNKGNEDDEEDDEEDEEKVRDSGEVRSKTQKRDEKAQEENIPVKTTSEGIAIDYNKEDEVDNVVEHESPVQVLSNTNTEPQNTRQQEHQPQQNESHIHEKTKVESASATQKKPNTAPSAKPNMTSWFKSEISYFLGHGNSHSSAQKPKGESATKVDLGTMMHLEPSVSIPANHTHQHQQHHQHAGLSDSVDTDKDSSLASLEDRDGRFSQDGDMQTGSDICPEDASHMHQSIEDANGTSQSKAARNDLTSHYLTASTKALASSLWKGAMTVKKLSGFDSTPAPLPPYVQVSFVESDATPLEKANHNYYDCLSTAHAKFYYDMGMCASGLLKIGDNTVVGLDKTRTHRRLAISDLRSLSQSCDEVDFVLRLNYLNKSDVPSRGTSVSTL